MSESEEMYLISIARLNESGQDPVPLGVLANELNVQLVSVNQMIKKLEEAGNVSYVPYKGVALTPSGELTAARTLRRRRLWEVFLAEQLGYSPVEADTIACQLEHAASDDVMERMSHYLGAPDFSPQGKPIPPAVTSDDNSQGFAIPLVSAAAGSMATVTAIKSKGAERSFLQQSGIQTGTGLAILAVQENGTCLVKPEAGSPVQLSAEVAQNIHIRFGDTA